MKPDDVREGEVLSADRAADGGRVFPAASTFGQFVGFLEEGQLDADLTIACRDLISELRDAAITNGGKAAGRLTLTLDVVLEGGMFTIKAKHALKLPEERRPKSVAWATEDGRFTPNRPGQGVLFGVRDVSASSRVRDA